MRRDPRIIGNDRQSPIRAVRQPPGSKVCGMACVAMLTGYDLETLTAIYFRNGGSATGMKTGDVVDCLRYFGVSTGKRNRLSPMRWNWRKQRVTRLVKLQIVGDKKNWHWVIFDGSRGFFIDPLGATNQDALAGRATSSIIVYGGPLNLSGRVTERKGGAT